MQIKAQSAKQSEGDKMDIPYRSPSYLEFIRSLPCVICRGRSEPHHTSKAGVGMKGSDYKAIPLCHGHHMECHTKGALTFQEKHNIEFKDQVIECLSLYASRKRWGQ